MIYVHNAQQVCSSEAQALMCMHDSCILLQLLAENFKSNMAGSGNIEC